MQSIIAFIVVFGVLVVVHELGHLIFAKRSGILVREFSIGMGPKIYGHQAKDGTTYTIRILPIGGYVRMAGFEEDESDIQPGTPISVVLEDEVITKINTSSKVQLTNSIPMEVIRQDLVDDLTITGYVNGDETQEVTYSVFHDATIIESDGTEVRIAPRDVQFQSAKLGNRMLTNFAGPLFNFILSLVLFIVYTFMIGGAVTTDTNQLGEIQADSPAAVAGLKSGDEVLEIDGQKPSNWTDIQQIVQANPEKELSLEIARDGQEMEIQATPKAEQASTGETIGLLGISPPIQTGFFEKIFGGIKMTITNSLAIFSALGSLVTSFSLDKLGGPVMIYKVSAEAASMGLPTLIAFMAMLSVNLGIVNLVPIPAFDGGKLLLNIIEGVRGKPLSQEKEGIITMVGVVIILILMISVTWNDIQRFFFN